MKGARLQAKQSFANPPYATLGADTLELAKARRYLEVRWGELLGTAERGGDRRSDQVASVRLETPLAKDSRRRFRQMAKAKTRVIELIQTAVDADELSRACVLKGLSATRPSKPARGVTKGEYGAIVIDPPWRYGNAATRGAAEDHYPTMSFNELMKLPELCQPLADSANSHLYLWTTTGMLREAFDLLCAWGYAYKTNLVWIKPQIGMGNYFRVGHEHVLFGIRGKAGRTLDRSLRTTFTAPRGRHSAKPDVFYELVEQASPGPYLDVFSRAGRHGHQERFRTSRERWDAWGNEA